MAVGKCNPHHAFVVMLIPPLPVPHLQFSFESLASSRLEEDDRTNPDSSLDLKIKHVRNDGNHLWDNSAMIYSQIVAIISPEVI